MEKFSTAHFDNLSKAASDAFGQRGVLVSVVPPAAFGCALLDIAICTGSSDYRFDLDTAMPCVSGAVDQQYRWLVCWTAFLWLPGCDVRFRLERNEIMQPR